MAGQQRRGRQATPLFVQAADTLRQQIASGSLVSGQQLPTEHALAQQLNVSRLTVRSALASLQREGLIVKRRGLGSFVRASRVRQILGRLETLDASIAEQGLASETRVLKFSFVTPDDALAAALHLPPGEEVLFARRLHSAEGTPIAVVDLSVASDIGSRLTRTDVEQKALYDLLPLKVGMNIGLATQTVRAEAATPEIAAALDIPTGSPVLVCERVTSTEAGQPVIHALFTYRADRFEFRVSLTAQERTVAWALPGLTASSDGLQASPGGSG